MPIKNLTIKTIDTVLVVGAGIMGHGFAQLLAMNKLNVYLVDQTDEFLGRARDWIQDNLEYMVELGELDNPEIWLQPIMFWKPSMKILNSSAASGIYLVKRPHHRPSWPPTRHPTISTNWPKACPTRSESSGLIGSIRPKSHPVWRLSLEMTPAKPTLIL